MTDKIRNQVMAIRNSGAANMMDVDRVQLLAFERGFHELVIFIEEKRKEYIRFILYGDAESK